MKISDAKAEYTDFRIAFNRDCLKNTFFKSLWLIDSFFKIKHISGNCPSRVLIVKTA